MSMAKMDGSSISKEKNKVVIITKSNPKVVKSPVRILNIFWFLFRDLVFVVEAHPGVLLRYQ